jgi:hypothetical protein
VLKSIVPKCKTLAMKKLVSILILICVFQFAFSQFVIGLNANVTNQNFTAVVFTPVLDYVQNKNVYTGGFQYVKQSTDNVDTEKYLNVNLAYKYFFKPQIYFGAYTGLNTKYVNTIGLHTGIVRKLYSHINGELKAYGEHRSHLNARSLESGISFILQLRI